MIGEMRSMIVPAAAFTARDVVGGLVLAAAAGGVFDRLAAPLPELPRRLISVAIAIVVLFHALKLWGRDIAQLAGRPGTEAINRTSASFLAAFFGTTGFVLGVTEPFVVGRAALRGIQIHEVYMLLFVTATLLVAAVGTFILGRGLHGPGFAARLGMRAGIAAAAAFLAVALTMDAVGWRVGAPGAARRATMIVVTMIGLVTAGIAAGAVVGMMLSRAQQPIR